MLAGIPIENPVGSFSKLALKKMYSLVGSYIHLQCEPTVRFKSETKHSFCIRSEHSDQIHKPAPASKTQVGQVVSIIRKVIAYPEPKIGIHMTVEADQITVSHIL